MDPSARGELPAPPVSRRNGNAAAIGAVLVVVGLLGVPACGVAALLTANPCGAFADQCADYGQTSGVAVAFVYGIMLSAGVLVAGVVVLIVALASRRREPAPSS